MALVIERFDRRWTESRRLRRLPQEDCCQALSVPPTRKYESEGGPGMTAILDLLKGSDTPSDDQKTFLVAHMVFWIIRATDGYAKNFSIFLEPGVGSAWHVLTAQPSFDSQKINRKQRRLGMCVGDNRHCRIDQIHPRHFLQVAALARVPVSAAKSAIEYVAEHGARAFDAVVQDLPDNFPKHINESARAAAIPRIKVFEAMAAGWRKEQI